MAYVVSEGEFVISIEQTSTRKRSTTKGRILDCFLKYFHYFVKERDTIHTMILPADILHHRKQKPRR